MDHRFLAAVLETAGFKPEFHKWISILYHNPQAVVQVNGRRSGAFAIERSVRQDFSSPLLYVLALEPLLRRLRDRGARPALRRILLSGSVRAKISAFADDITVFVSRRRDILAVKEAVARYEKVAGAKVNFDKSKGFRLGAWRGSVPLPGPFRWSDSPVRILGVWFGPGLQLERNWLEVRAKVEARVVAWLRRRLSLKGRAEVCAVYIFPLILYRLSVLPLPKDHRAALIRSLFKLLWKGLLSTSSRWGSGDAGSREPPARWETGLPGPLVDHGRSVEPQGQGRIPWTGVVSSAEGRRRPSDEPPFVIECHRALRKLPRSSNLSWTRKELYRELVVGSASDPLVDRFGWSAEEIRSQWNWAPGSGFLNNEFSLTWQLARNVLALNNWAYRACLADMPDCTHCASGLEETALHAFYYCEWVRPFWSHVEEWTARISPRELVPLDVGYIVDNVSPSFRGEKRMVFLVILAVARMVIWQRWNKGLYEGANFSYRYLILFFRHQLRVKIRCDRKCLDRITFSKRWVHAASLVVCKGATLESSFPPLPAHGDDGPGPLGPHPR